MDEHSSKSKRIVFTTSTSDQNQIGQKILLKLN